MKIWVMLILCASALSLPVDDRLTTLEELIQKVLAAHPLENDIELSKQQNEVSHPDRKNQTQILPKEGEPLNNNSTEGEDTQNDEIIPSDFMEEKDNTEMPLLKEDAPTSGREPEFDLTTIHTTAPEGERKEAPAVTAEVRDMTFDPRIYVTEQKPKADATPLATPDIKTGNDEKLFKKPTIVKLSEGRQPMDKVETDEEQLKGANAEGGIEEEPIQEEESVIIKVEPETDTENPTGEINPEVFDFIPIIVPEEATFDQDPLAKEDDLSEGPSLSRIPLEKQAFPDEDMAESPNLNEDETKPDLMVDDANPDESIPETSAFENPFLMPDDTLLNEPDLLEGIPMQESSEVVPTENYPFEDNPEGTEASPVETTINPLNRSLDSLSSASERQGTEPQLQSEVTVPFGEDEYLPSYDDEMTELMPSKKYNPEIFRRIESPEHFGDFEIFRDVNSPTLSPLDEDPEMFTISEHFEDDPVPYDTAITDAAEEPMSETDQIFDDQLDTTFPEDTNPENIPFVMDSNIEKQKNTPYLTAYTREVPENTPYDQLTPEENPESLSIEPAVKMDESIGHTQHESLLATVDQAPEYELREPMPENENLDTMVDESLYDMGSDAEGLGPDPTTNMDTMLYNAPYDSDLIHERYPEDIPNNEDTPYNPGMYTDEDLENMAHRSGVMMGETPDIIPYEPRPKMEENQGDMVYGPISYMGENPKIIPYIPAMKMSHILENSPYELVQSVDDGQRFGTHMDMHPDNLPLRHAPMQEIAGSSFYDPHKHSNMALNPFSHQLWQTENDFDAYQPMVEEGDQMPITLYPIEDVISDSSVKRPIKKALTKTETEMPISQNAQEYSDVAEVEAMMSKDMSQTGDETKGDGRSENSVPAGDQQITPMTEESEFERPRVVDEAPFPLTDYNLYPYSFVMKNYEPFYFPYPLENGFLEKPSTRNDYKSVIIVLDPSAKFLSDTDTPSLDVNKVEMAADNKVNETTTPISEVEEQDPDSPVTGEADPMMPDPSFRPNMEIPYPSEDQDFFSGQEGYVRQPFTWYPISRQQASNFRRFRPFTPKEYEFVVANPYQDTIHDYSQYPTEYYEIQNEPQYYESGSGFDRKEVGFVPYVNPYYFREEVYNRKPVRFFDHFYY